MSKLYSSSARDIISNTKKAKQLIPMIKLKRPAVILRTLIAGATRVIAYIVTFSNESFHVSTSITTSGITS